VERAVRRLALVALVMLAGCAKIHVVCPTDSIEHVMIGGNNVGTVAITALIAMGGKAGLMAPRNAAAAPDVAASQTTVDYTYSPIFGTDYVQCGAGPIPK